MAKVASPFIPLNLSHHEAHYLRELVHVFVQHHVETYERYVHDDQRCMDNKYWKQILHRDDMRVFSGRQCDKNEESCECSDCINQQKSSELTSLPTLLTVGHMEGSLDDAMYGMMTPTVAAMRLKNFYAEDHMAKGAVLVTIDKPSATDPFRSLDVKWVESYQPPMLRSIISNRDFVYMEATGFTELRDGEMVGYRIVHSVHFPQTPKVGNNIRGNMSTCGLYRQRYHNTVEVYIRASSNSGGYAPRSYGVKYESIALISARKMIRCAHRKKLSWLLGQCDATVILGEAKCIGCGQKPGIFATYIGSCALCKRALCSPCRIKIEVGYVTLRGSLVKKKMWFCTYCLDEARQTSSRVVALEEYVGTRLVASIPWSCSPTQSNTASVLDRSDD